LSRVVPWFAPALAAACAIAAAAAAQTAPPAFSAAERAAAVQALRQGGERDEASAGRLDDATLQATLLRYATQELGQRVRPAEVERLWALQPARRDPIAELAEARRLGRLAPWLQGLAPPFAGYRALQSAARRYRDIVATGGWAALPPGPAFRQGARDPQITALRARLAIEGYRAPPARESDLFDPGLSELLAAFQSHHGLPADGALGPQTRTALNVPAEERLVAIDANLERWRWLPHDLPADRLEVDVAGAEATLFQGDTPQLSMRIVVGDARHQTPMFASALEAVVFNPPWNVPPSIARAEILPKEAKSPGYLARNDYVWIDGHLQQLPGAKNALGVIKFDLPSPFGVYLHDTPSKSAFQRQVRALSHGCMRLEKPRELAALLLAPQGWTPDRIAAAISEKTTQRTPLKMRTPLYVLYWTAAAGPGGDVDFRPDVYHWDTKLAAALADARVASAALPRLATDCTEASDTPS
jgi:murein L,D-transpeptidase YcbB/YkuD